MEDTGIPQRRTTLGDEAACPGLVGAAANNSPAAHPGSAPVRRALPRTPVPGRAKTPCLHLKSWQPSWRTKHARAKSEGIGTAACDGEAEGPGKDRTADAELHQPGNTRGAPRTGEPTEPPREAQGTARHSATGRAGRSLTTSHPRVALAGRSGTSLPSVSSPLPSLGRPLNDHNQDLLWATEHSPPVGFKEAVCSSRKGGEG